MEFLSSLKQWKRYVIPAVIGSALGYAYYHFVGCATGRCPLSSNPWIMTIYGATMGILLTPRQRKSES